MTPTVDNEGRYVPPQPPDDPSLRSLSDSLQLLVGTEAGNCARILRPVAALDEVVAISDAVAEGHAPPQPHDRRSLAVDVDVALSMLGPETKAYLGASVSDYRAQEIPKLEEFLDDGAGAKRVLHAARHLRERLKHPLAVQAAWRDLVARVRSGRPESEAQHAALVLVELAESLGHEWRWVRSRIHDALVAGNLDEVERELGEPPSRTARAAWFAFADAHVPRGYLRLGQVQFFSHEIWPDLVRHESALLKTYPEAEYPSELDDRMTSYMSGVKPGATKEATAEEQREAAAAEHRVFARVELTGPRASGAQNPWAHGRPPDKWARDLVVGLVEAATFRWGGSQWKLLEGAFVYHGEITFRDETEPNWSGNLGFRDPDVFERNRRSRPPHLEPTGTALRELDPAFAERAAAGDPAAEAAITHARWYRAAKAQGDGAQRIALHVRTFERVLPIAGSEHWYDTVSRYFREFWARGTFDLDVRDALLATADWLGWQGIKPEDLGELGGWLENLPSGKQSLDLQTFLRVVGDVEPLLTISAEQPDACRHRRRLRDLARIAATRENARVRHEQLATEFDVLLNRAVRQRNAVIHGVHTIEAVVASVEPFIAQLAAWLVNDALEHAAEGTNLLDGLEADRAAARERFDRLARGDGGSVPELLYFSTSSGQ